MNDIGGNTVAVATVRLDDVPPGVVRVLSRDELARAEAMRDGRHRARFMAGRARLREMLATLTGGEPAALAFDYGASGKPVLRPTGDTTCASPHFSVTHSGGLALIAVTHVGPVGVDVEQLREVPRAEAIARRVLGDGAATAVARLRGAERDAHFLRLWTLREAAVKAAGHSIWSGVTAEQEPVVRSIEAEPGYLAAVAVLGAGAHSDWSVERFSFDAVRYREPEGV